MSTFSRGMRAAVVLMLLGAGVMGAQDAPRGLSVVRDGLGYSDELYRPTISIRLGGTPSQQLRLGGEILAWINEQGDAVESLSSFLFVGQLYPARSTGLYLKGGLGLGRNAVDFEDGYGGGDTGFAGLIGAGWELRLGRRWYLNPAVDLVEHRYSNRGGSDYRERLVNVGIGVLFQSGR